MTNLSSLLKKDWKEYLRGNKYLIFSLVLFGLGAMLLLTTRYFPLLMDAMNQLAPGMVLDPQALNQTIGNFYAADMRTSFGLWAPDVCLFYTILVVLITLNIIPNERHRGCWIMPNAVGYKKSQILLSKCIVYSLGASLPVFVFSLIYYAVSALFMVHDLAFGEALIDSVVLTIAMATIVVVTILTSAIGKHPIIAAISIIVFVLLGPDLLALFTFGRYLPTYILSYVYMMEYDLGALIIPIIEIIIMDFVLFKIAVAKLEKCEY